ncbi:MAG: thiamine-phosphate kinase [Dehalococcoidales bacterium]|jgi:thiamine-monophosphate kinase|nr:thiamine-phosphate kinase [Dehalococcoidales bacterium]MDD3265107.1 thiamine-phosphate kinase [Dehalococcoidales bacterium]MDD4322600.1 thiamine-phosphate kinase [Dehalococcoidales bacterium]MDD4794160.1 thiamine-phosphate kinase [Dehalococcoidales bacterium]MDD5122497.1 thiamine-phosphate kinase [Dehalococcoidales bacterium]
MKVEETGEFELIELIKSTIGNDPNLLIGIGDDACAWQSDNAIHLATTDSLVEGIHFESSLTNWSDLGYKALAVNLSDIAAMGGKGRLALVSMALPGRMETENVINFYQGMLELARETGVSIGGGNISRSPVINITVAAIGTSLADGLLRRSGAATGDLIAITGNPGSSAGGRMLLTSTPNADRACAAPLLKAFTRPHPRLAEGQILVKKKASSCIDISDGLLADLYHILEASGVSATVDTDKLPIETLLEAGFSQKHAVELCLGGGEDYELMFTANQNAMKNIAEDFTIPVSVIGSIIDGIPGSIALTGELAPTENINLFGWKHFG